MHLDAIGIVNDVRDTMLAAQLSLRTKKHVGELAPKDRACGLMVPGTKLRHARREDTANTQKRMQSQAATCHFDNAIWAARCKAAGGRDDSRNGASTQPLYLQNNTTTDDATSIGTMDRRTKDQCGSAAM